MPYITRNKNKVKKQTPYNCVDGSDWSSNIHPMEHSLPYDSYDSPVKAWSGLIKFVYVVEDGTIGGNTS